MIFYLFNSQLNLKAFGSDTSGFAVCISVCLTSLTPFPPPSQNTVRVFNQITLLILYYISYRLVILLKVTDAPIQVPNIFYLTVSFNFLKFSSQICFLFVPEMSDSFTSYNVQIIIKDSWGYQPNKKMWVGQLVCKEVREAICKHLVR